MFFFTSCKDKMNEDNKLKIMTNVGKNRLVKITFTTIHKISDACANSFGRYIIMFAQCMEKCFYFLVNSSFSEKM